MEILLSEVEETDDGLLYRSFYTERYGAGTLCDQDERSIAHGSLVAVFLDKDGITKGTPRKISNSFNPDYVRDDKLARAFLLNICFPNLD